MIRTMIMPLALVAGVMGAGGAVAAEPDAAAKERTRPPLFEKLIDCRKIADPAQRLACYDTQVAAIDDAEKRDDVVVVDRAQVRKTRRALFGLNLSGIDIFGGNKDEQGRPEEEGVTKIESTLKAISSTRDGKYVFTLDDGARWQATEAKVTGRTPKPGEPIVIRRGALGSYIASIGGRQGVKVIRLN